MIRSGGVMDVDDKKDRRDRKNQQYPWSPSAHEIILFRASS